MPTESFATPPEKKSVREIKNTLEGLPAHQLEALKAFRQTVVWPINSKKRRVAELIAGDELQPPDEELLGRWIDSEDPIYQEIAEFVVKTHHEELSTDLKSRPDVAEWVAEMEKDKPLTSSVDPNPQAEQARNLDSPSQKHLLGSRRPLFSNSDVEGTADKLSKIKEAFEEIKRISKGKVYGISILGSTSKGVHKADSDIDYVLFTEDGSYRDYFNQVLKTYGIEHCHTMAMTLNDFSIRSNYPDYPNYLFTGIFLGDRTRLQEMQLAYLKQLQEKNNDPENEWNALRKDVWGVERSLQVGRIKNFSWEEESRVRFMVGLTRVPPSLKEAVAVLEKRSKFEQQLAESPAEETNRISDIVKRLRDKRAT